MDLTQVLTTSLLILLNLLAVLILAFIVQVIIGIRGLLLELGGSHPDGEWAK